MRRGVLGAFGFLLLSLGPVLVRAEGQVLPDARRYPLRFAHQGNTLSVVERYSVHFHDSASLLEGARDRPATNPYLAVLVRNHPRQLVQYITAVTEEGTLVVARQVQDWDFDSQRYEFSDIVIDRSYPPLEGRSGLTWFVSIQVSRECLASFELSADQADPPVRLLRVKSVNSCAAR
jgi:hypothetical protein